MRGKRVGLVLSDDYWESNQYSFLSQCRPCFVSTGRKLGDPRGFELLDSARKIGVLLTGDSKLDVDGSIVLGDRRWQLIPVTRAGTRRLYLGTRD